MKKHIAALDGLRGFAALTVVISHLHLNINVPILSILWTILGSGPNGVQILFVLSGFLMAYLYPYLTKPFEFIQKRYTRIFPTFGTVVLYLWFVKEYKISNIFIQVLVLLLVAVIAHFVWKGIRKMQEKIPVSSAIFYGFLVLQLVTLLILLFIIPKFPFFQQVNFLHDILTLFANLTLTMPFSIQTIRLSGVFWSLVPEVLFYLLFPFFVIPLIRLAQKGGFLVTVFLVIGLTKVLFDLDTQLFSLASLLTINIARSSGFIVGVIVGTLYKENHPLWQQMQKVLTKHFFQFCILGLFIFMEWGDAGLRDGHSLTFNNYYFFLFSWVIGLLLLLILSPKTLPQKLFSNKILVFLGVISYTLYLTHHQIIDGIETLLLPIQNMFPSGIYPSIFIVVSILGSIGVAWVLFALVDNLYFLGKKSAKKLNIQTEQQKEISFSPLYYCGIAFVGCLMIFSAYSGTFSKSLLVERQYYENNLLKIPDTSLTEKPVFIPISVKSANFSIVGLDLLYKLQGDAPKVPSQVVFQLYDDHNKLLFQSKTNTDLLVATSHFQFGFPPIIDSEGKNYRIGLSLMKNGKEEILLHKEHAGFLSMSVTPSGNKILSLLSVFLNRIFFTVTSPNAVIAMLFFILLPLIGIFVNKNRYLNQKV